MDETVRLVDEAITQKKQLHHVVINAGKVVAISKDPELRRSVISSDVINADGQAIVWAIRFLGSNIPERVAGVDLMNNLVSLAHLSGYKCYFFGAREHIVKKVVETLSQTYSPALIAGYRPGWNGFPA